MLLISYVYLILFRETKKIKRAPVLVHAQEGEGHHLPVIHQRMKKERISQTLHLQKRTFKSTTLFTLTRKITGVEFAMHFLVRPRSTCITCIVQSIKSK